MKSLISKVGIKELNSTSQLREFLENAASPIKHQVHQYTTIQRGLGKGSWNFSCSVVHHTLDPIYQQECEILHP